MPDKIRVLVLEDDADMRSMLVSLLESEGYEVCSASNGLEALGHTRTRPFDLVVADVRMDGMSGLDVLETVHNEAPATRSLVITGYASEEDSIRAIRLGVGDYLRKPFRLADFRQSVARRVEERRRELEQQGKDTSMRRTALGALRALVGTQAAPPRAGELASRLGGALGGSQEACESLEIAALIETLRLQGLGALVEWAASDPRWGTLAAEAARPWAEVGREARILAVALAAAARERELEEEPASLAVELSQAHPGRFDPTVLEALERPPEAAPSEHRRGLLTLARALEGAGDRTGAEAAYHELSASAVASQEVVSALLALGRLERSRERLQQAVQVARALGPAAAGQALLEAGLMLNDAALLGDAARLLGDVGNPGSAAQAHVGLVRARGEGDLEGALGLLLQHPRELAACSLWLVPFLRSVRCGPLGAEALARLGVDAPTPRGLRVQSLGSFEVFRGSVRVAESDWVTKKSKYLFAYLCARGRFVNEDVLIEEFWPGDGDKGKKALYTTTSRLRKSLQQEVDPILRRDGHLQVNPELALWHDLDELEECLKQAGLEGARRVAQLYRGPFLDGCYMEFALPIRARLEREVSTLLFRLAQHCWSQRRLEEAQEYAQRTLDVDPCHQESHLLAMHAFMAANRPEEAVRQYERAERLLRQQMDMVPSLELMEAFQRARLSIP